MLAACSFGLCRINYSHAFLPTDSTQDTSNKKGKLQGYGSNHTGFHNACVSLWSNSITEIKVTRLHRTGALEEGFWRPKKENWSDYFDQRIKNKKPSRRPSASFPVNNPNFIHSSRELWPPPPLSWHCSALLSPSPLHSPLSLSRHAGEASCALCRMGWGEVNKWRARTCLGEIDECLSFSLQVAECSSFGQRRVIRTLAAHSFRKRSDAAHPTHAPRINQFGRNTQHNL